MMKFKLSSFGHGSALRKATLALVAVATLATAAPQTAMAGGGWDPGAAAAIGVIGGLALGAAISGNGHSRVEYGYGGGGGYGYRGNSGYVDNGPSYYAPDYGYRHRHSYYAWSQPQEDCYVVRQRFWVEGWGWQYRPRTVCN
jgi:hypothetical protein